MSGVAGWRVRWRLAELLAANNTLSQTDVAKALAKDGAHPVSRTQVGRLAGKTPDLVPFELVGALCRVLQCSPNDLFGWGPAPAQERSPGLRTLRAVGRKAAARGTVAELPGPPEGLPELDEEQRRRLVGPSVKALAPHPLARRRGGAK